MSKEIPAKTLLSFMLYLAGLQEWTGHLFDGFTNLVKSAGAGSKVSYLSDTISFGNSAEGHVVTYHPFSGI